MAPAAMAEPVGAGSLRWRLSLPLPPAHSAAPFYRREEMAWIVSRYDDVQAMLRHPDVVEPEMAEGVRMVCQRGGVVAPALSLAADGFMLCQRGQSHRMTRAALAEPLGQQRARWKDARLAERVEAMLAEVGFDAAVDLVPLLIDRLPNLVGASLLDMPEDDLSRLRPIGIAVADAWRPGVSLRDYRRFEMATVRMHDVLAGRQPSSDRHHLALDPPAMRIGVEIFLISASIVTVSGSMGSAVHLLAQSAALQDRLRRTPDLLPAFVEEVLRLGGGVRRLVARRAARPVEIGGVGLPVGALIVADIEAASRDPDAYSDPDLLDLGRAAPPTLAFGGGRHACLGPRLARVEIIAALRGLLTRFTLSPSDEPVLESHPDFRYYRTLPVRLSAA